MYVHNVVFSPFTTNDVVYTDKLLLFFFLILNRYIMFTISRIIGKDYKGNLEKIPEILDKKFE